MFIRGLPGEYKTTKSKGWRTLRTKHKVHTNKDELIGKNSQEMGEDDTSTCMNLVWNLKL